MMHRGFFIVFSKILFAGFINIIFWEVFMRLFISSPCTQIPDKKLGYLNMPHAVYMESMEGYCRTVFNSLGFNDHEPLDNVEKKVLVVGDSFTESFQVAKDKCYVQVAENMINQYYGNPTVDLIKLGRDGFTPAHYPEVIDRYYDFFNPQIIVIQFGNHSGYDLYSNQVKAKYGKKGNLTGLDLQIRDEDRQKERLRHVINNSAVIYYVLRKYKPLIMKGIDGFQNFKSKFNFTHSQKIKPSSPDQKRDLHDMSRRFGVVLDSVMKYKTKIIIIYIEKSGSEMVRKNVAKDSETYNALKHAAVRRSIEVVRFDKKFQSFFLEHKIPVYGFFNTLPGKGHLNGYGHLIVGSSLLDYLINIKDNK